jgi:hypothetical protein
MNLLHSIALRGSRAVKYLPLLSLLSLFIAIPLSATQDAGDKGQIRGRFVGAWRLSWLEEPDAGGGIHRADCTGLLVYTPDGHMSIQVMYRNAQTGSNQYAQGGYEASFGTYHVDESAHTFTFHVDGAMVRSLIGKDLPRRFEFSGNQLLVKSTDPKEHWSVAWERY